MNENLSKPNEATYAGQKPDRGLLIIGKEYPKEGFATIKCGGTEVRLGYTILQAMHLAIDGQNLQFADLCATQKALDSITCEASLGHTG